MIFYCLMKKTSKQFRIIIERPYHTKKEEIIPPVQLDDEIIDEDEVEEYVVEEDDESNKNERVKRARRSLRTGEGRRPRR